MTMWEIVTQLARSVGRPHRTLSFLSAQTVIPSAAEESEPFIHNPLHSQPTHPGRPSPVVSELIRNPHSTVFPDLIRNLGAWGDTVSSTGSRFHRQPTRAAVRAGTA